VRELGAGLVASAATEGGNPYAACGAAIARIPLPRLHPNLRGAVPLVRRSSSELV
jgi:hypothetical protein